MLDLVGNEPGRRGRGEWIDTGHGEKILLTDLNDGSAQKSADLGDRRVGVVEFDRSVGLMGEGEMSDFCF
jgi:hypothetical protein